MLYIALLLQPSHDLERMKSLSVDPPNLSEWILNGYLFFENQKKICLRFRNLSFQKIQIEKMKKASPFFVEDMWVFPKIVVPPHHPILIGFSIINHPFWGTTIFGNTHVTLTHFDNLNFMHFFWGVDSADVSYEMLHGFPGNSAFPCPF